MRMEVTGKMSVLKIFMLLVLSLVCASSEGSAETSDEAVIKHGTTSFSISQGAVSKVWKHARVNVPNLRLLAVSVQLPEHEDRGDSSVRKVSNKLKIEIENESELGPASTFNIRKSKTDKVHKNETQNIGLLKHETYEMLKNETEHMLKPETEIMVKRKTELTSSTAATFSIENPETGHKSGSKQLVFNMRTSKTGNTISPQEPIGLSVVWNNVSVEHVEKHETVDHRFLQDKDIPSQSAKKSVRAEMNGSMDSPISRQARVDNFNFSFHDEHQQTSTLLGRFKRAFLTKKERVLKKFREYYDCIHNSNPYRRWYLKTALIFQEGENVELSCKLCIRPDQNFRDYHVGWRRFLQGTSKMSFINPSSSSHVVMQKDKSLLIKKIDLKDAGEYVCVYRGGYFAAYHVDILLEDQRRTIFEDDPDYKPLVDLFLTWHNLHVFTTWSDWSPCNKCGEEGLRRRLGMCTVKKMKFDMQCKPEEIWGLKFMPDGAPCKSTVIPKSIRGISFIKERKTQAILGKCFAECPTAAEIKTVTDANGNVVRHIHVTYHDFNEAPKLKLPPKRDFMYKDAGQKLVLKCPGAGSERKHEEMIRWQNGTTVLDTLTIRRKTRGRVIIDHMGQLTIRRLRVTDTAPYNCWVGDYHLATIKVIVVKPMSKNLNSYISVAGFAITVIAIVGLAMSVCCRKKPRTAR